MAFIIFVFGVINTMVSLKYETDSPGDCISTVTGIDLCEAIKFNKIAALSTFLLAVAASIYRLFFIKAWKSS